MRKGSAYVFRLTAVAADRLERRLNSHRPVDGLLFESLVPQALMLSDLDEASHAPQHAWLSYRPGVDGEAATYLERIRPGSAPASLRLQKKSLDCATGGNPTNPTIVAQFERSRWTTRAPFQIELRLDRGRIDGSGPTVDYAELLLYTLPHETDSATPLPSSRKARSALLVLASHLNRIAPLFVRAETAIQAELRANTEALRPVKHKSAAWPPTEALCRKALEDVLAHWLANQDGVRSQCDIEFTHQLRVALRRLATALKVFCPQLAADWLAAIEPELRWLRTLLGTARDWDVFVEATVPAISADIADLGAAMPAASELTGLRAQAVGEQALAHDAVVAALDSPRYASLMLTLLQGVAALAPPHPHLAVPAGLRRRAKRWLRKNDLGGRGLHALVDGTGATFRAWPAPRQHKLRLRAKRMRYALEFLAPLLRTGALRRAQRHYVALLDALGRANDAVVGARLSQQLPLGDALQDYAQHSLAARRQASLRAVETHLPRLRRARLKRV